MQDKIKTFESVQALRAIAAILVALFHFQLAYVRSGRIDAHGLETYIFGFGAVGVHIFFVISGFIMVVTNPDPARFNALAFFWRRLVRIFPIYWICCAAYLFVHAVYHDHSFSSVWQLLAALLLLPAHAPDIVGPAWTLPFELYFYLCFGVIMVLFRANSLKLLSIFFLISVAIGVAHHWVSPEARILTNGLLLEFLLGALIGRLAIKRRLPERLSVPLTALALAIFAGGYLYGYHRLPSLLGWGLPSMLLMLGLVSWESRRPAAPQLRQFVRLGDSSYVLYLIHPLVIILAIKAGILSRWLWLGPVTGSCVLTAACVVLAHLVHRKMESPLLDWLKSKAPTRAKPPAPVVLPDEAPLLATP